MGLSLAVLRAHLDLCQRSRADGCLVAYKGQIVQEWYGPGYANPPVSAGLRRSMRSAGKSMAGLLAGMLIGDGALALDDPTAKWIPEWKAGVDSAVTVRHLLSMTSGLPRTYGCPPGTSCATDATAYALAASLTQSPGERIIYSNEGSQLLSPILERAAGMPLHEYAQTRLFEPLGLDSTRLDTDEAGNTITVAGPTTALREAAAIGQLVANGGMWNGMQIVPAAWVQSLAAPSGSFPYYSYLWWLDSNAGALFAAGDLDNIIAVYPEEEIVAVRVQFSPHDDAEVTYYSPSTFHLLRALPEQRRSVPTN